MTSRSPCSPTEVPTRTLARQLLDRGVGVVSVSDDLADVRSMLDLDDTARAAGVPMVVGAGMDPGLTGLLARLSVANLATCDEIHVSIHGTAGPACARRHHRALSGRALGFHDGEWTQPTAGSGRELCWFPEPVGPYDCYRRRAGLPAAAARIVRRRHPDLGAGLGQSTRPVHRLVADAQPAAP